MGRPRKEGNDLPNRMYLRSGTYYYVDTANKWHNLGQDLGLAKTRLGDHVRPITQGSFAALSKRYMAEVSPTKSPRTHADNRLYARHVESVFGHMMVDKIKPFDIAKYHDLRGQRAPIQANRELS
jgi:hypothetical protein